MQKIAILRILGFLLMLSSFTMVPPVLVSLVYNDGAMMAFVTAFFLTVLLGSILWFPVRNLKADMRLRDGFLIVVMFWLVTGMAGALPLILSEAPVLSVTDSVFEAMSGLTTTGATVIVGLDELPKSILYYRQQLQWIGGIGIVVLAVAVLPMLGIGGMQLYRAETPGPMKDSKLTPRITETAKALWYIYLGLTVVCAGAYWAAGMDLFDAIGHSFATVAIGGFSTHDQSLGYFDSNLVNAVAMVFMILAAVNFSLHFLAWRSFTVKPYFYDEEFRAYMKVLAFTAILTVGFLYYQGTYTNLSDALHHGLFQAISAGTTTGFTTAEFQAWPGFLPALLILVSFVGGCAGSTGGGMKVIRMLLLVKQGVREVVRLVHPSAQIPVKMGNKPLEERVMQSVWGFFSLYVASYIVMSLLLAGSGLDLITAFSAVAACMNNLGPGLGEVGANYASINDFAKWVLCFAMLLGRLEIFTLLVLLSTTFWRK
ncbi:MAG: TrkH family potassium uptake protein [Gammaproteobacteria bacterium]|nr:TrkH family potassium uptake protein [Gammaproteobacteria bacterium]